MKREFRFTIGDEQHPVIGVLGDVELVGSTWQATIVPHEGAEPVTQLATTQLNAVLGCIEQWAIGSGE